MVDKLKSMVKSRRFWTVGSVVSLNETLGIPEAICDCNRMDYWRFCKTNRIKIKRFYYIKGDIFCLFVG